MPISQFLFQSRGDVMGLKNLLKNDDAVSISIGFILMFSITVLLFATIILVFYTFISLSEKTSMKESFEIQGNGLAIKIITIDTLVNISNSYGGTLNTLEYEFSIPATIAGKTYTMNLTDKQIIIESDNGAKAWVPFNSSSRLADLVIGSGAQNYKLAYNRTYNEINIEEQ